jgi:hypothetical protein
VLTCCLQAGKGLIKVNGRPLQLVQPEILRFKVRTTILLQFPSKSSRLFRLLTMGRVLVMLAAGDVIQK